ncbi:MAG TPA: PEP-CTERM sorting domain-containing protein [Rhizomicrobium sp.]|nr:PEP-CTERM sorting domain-containing protein [Rhizomicrobium sp.]
MHKNITLALVVTVLVAAAPAAATPNLISNGNFGTGDFANWILGTYSYGVDIGNGGNPAITSFDITGGGAQSAAIFSVGIASGPSFGGDSGGGVSLSQLFTTSGGTINFSANIASVASLRNANGGTFTALINGVNIASYSFGSIADNTTELATLVGSQPFGPGTYNLEIDISRNFFVGAGTAPFQLISNIVVSGPTVVPEPLTISLFGAGAVGAFVARRRKFKRT